MTKREAVKMVDGRVYFSTDGWHTIWKAHGAKGGASRIVKGEEAKVARLIGIIAYPAYVDGQCRKRK